ncbi:MAG: oligosaccharide flippase family protein [Pseudomonadales bacterium]|nr:oligosaccharide flippase family protein [Pseudomonadales bacterium]MCP5188061.1 oligosaccharide flippase family protein [Pseudomonadales bacterium]
MLRDVLQFAAMLVMVRLLTPEDYGTAALAQSVLGILAITSFGNFAAHAFQFRDPFEIDWQAHFTAAVFINVTLFLMTIIVAWALSSTQRYAGAALPLAALSTTFLVEIPATLRNRMLETQHDWVRFRLLLILGTMLALGAGLAVGLLGGGVWALVVQPPLFGLPAAIDLIWRAQWRPDWSWSWARYRDTATFGFNRMGAAAAIRGRQTVEQTLMAGKYDFAALGVFTRAMGLATLVAGRLGSVAMQALYPVVTRAEIRSAKFQRMAGLVLQGVCWTTIPAAAFFAFNARDTVSLLYGQQWLSVTPLLPLAVIGVALNGVAATLSSLLLANNEIRFCLLIDVTGALVAIILAFLLIPINIVTYLAALAGLGLLTVIFFLSALVMTNGLGLKSVVTAVFPSLVACIFAVLIIQIGRYLVNDSYPAIVQLLTFGIGFAGMYLAVLRLGFPSATRALLEVVPAGHSMIRWLRFSNLHYSSKVP